MTEAGSALSASVGAFLPAWVEQQRWFVGRGRVPTLRRVGVLRHEDPARRATLETLLVLDESAAEPTVYQVPLSYRDARLPGGDEALVGTLEDAAGGTRFVYDGPRDPVFAEVLLQTMLAETSVGSTDADDATRARGHRQPGSPALRVVASRVLRGEQSNTSIIYDTTTADGAPQPLICKVFRVLHHGDNPDVVVQSALALGGSTLVPRPFGHVSGEWPDDRHPGGTAVGHLAFAQEFLPGVEDAWRVAADAVARGEDFSDRARALGSATADVHATLAEVMPTVQATESDRADLLGSMQSRHANANNEVPALAAYDKAAREIFLAAATAPWPALQRIHGDYHLGQVLDVPGRGWVLLDFEGEPLRPLAERSVPDLTLRDVAGMLRSFDYAAGSWEQAHPGSSAAAWAEAARAAFLDGYAERSGRDPRDDRALLAALELDKALYEVVYEARNRPSWLSIPVAAIARLTDSARSTR
jgi:predicted trehalose synthase